MSQQGLVNGVSYIVLEGPKASPDEANSTKERFWERWDLILRGPKREQVSVDATLLQYFAPPEGDAGIGGQLTGLIDTEEGRKKFRIINYNLRAGVALSSGLVIE